jgi:propanediol utilization protein
MSNNLSSENIKALQGYAEEFLREHNLVKSSQEAQKDIITVAAETTGLKKKTIRGFLKSYCANDAEDKLTEAQEISVMISVVK